MLMGVLKYTPDEAYSFTLPLFRLAMKGHLRAQGQKPPEERFVTRNELLTLMGK